MKNPYPPSLWTRASRLARLPYASWRYGLLRGGWFRHHLKTHRGFHAASLPPDTPIDVMVSCVDHFEPTRRHGDEAAEASVREWCDRFEKLARQHVDSDGVCFQHSWFYRAEYENPGCVRALGDYTFRGLGEVDFHLHHGNDDHESFARRLQDGLRLFEKYGAMVTAEDSPRRRFAYIAGNWSLDNGANTPHTSGCNTELIALKDAGCYADFTFPAIGSPAQPKTSNSIYYAADDPQPKSYDTGVTMEVGGAPSGDLLIFQGPSLFSFSNGYVENAAVEDFQPATPERLAYWLNAHVHVRGRPEWVFVKLHTHGMQSKKTFERSALDETLRAMAVQWKTAPLRLHFVTARESYNIAKAAEAGHRGNPNEFRNFEVPLPANRWFRCGVPWRLEHFTAHAVRISCENPGLEPITLHSNRPEFQQVTGSLRSFAAEFSRGAKPWFQAIGSGQIDIHTSSGVVQIQAESPSAHAPGPDPISANPMTI